MEVNGSASCSGHIMHEEMSPTGTQEIGGWVGSEAGLDVLVKRKSFIPLSIAHICTHTVYLLFH